MTADHPNARLLERFYGAFRARDADGMAACYRPDVWFSDEVFPDLKGASASGMWRMLCAQGKDLKLEASQFRANDAAGAAHWEAWYSFSATGRSVHNVIEARFEFCEGLIARHVDRFDFWAWSRQALGLPGLLLGWTPLLQGRVQRTAATRLQKFLERHRL